MPTNQLVNVSEVADMLGISKRTVHQRIGAGRIAPIQKMPGQTGQYLFDRAYIEQIAADERDAPRSRPRRPLPRITRSRTSARGLSSSTPSTAPLTEMTLHDPGVGNPEGRGGLLAGV